jgi:hypothetical protein
MDDVLPREHFGFLSGTSKKWLAVTLLATAMPCNERGLDAKAVFSIMPPGFWPSVLPSESGDMYPTLAHGATTPDSPFTKDFQATNFPWVESPMFSALLPHAGLDETTQKLVKQYHEEGYVIIDPELGAKTVDGAVSDLAGKFQGRVQDAWKQSACVKQIATSPKVLKLLQALYRREPIPFQTLNFNVGTEQDTHSDSIHFHSIPERFMCGVWVALEDVDEYNGPLHYYPGSHRMKSIDMHDLGLSGSMSQPHEVYPKYLEFLRTYIALHGLKKLDVKLKKGQALVWSANLLHGGSPILDKSRTRHSQVTHYYFSDCLYYTPMMSDLALGKVYARKITNILTGKEVPQAYNGLAVANPGEWPPQVIEKKRAAA